MSDPSPPAGPRGPFGADAWRRAAADQLAHVEAVSDESARVEALALALARAAIDESARLARATLDYGARLSAAYRALLSEAVRRSLDLLGPGAR